MTVVATPHGARQRLTDLIEVYSLPSLPRVSDLNPKPAGLIERPTPNRVLPNLPILD